MLYRIENDLLGERQIPVDALWGIHTLRAAENFPLSMRRIDKGLISAYGAVKLAAAEVNSRLGFLATDVATAIMTAAREMADGLLDEHIIVDALQGGAGTSTNMNVNEVLANRALILLAHKPGRYDIIDPLDHVNLHQSTNDTYPTALKIACIYKLNTLEQAVAALVEQFQLKEAATAGVVKIARTQLQDAVLTTVGREMSAYAEAFARDRWRIYKCVERLRVVNMGGTAIGTGLGAPRQYIFQTIEQLRVITGLGLARAENMIENTQNADVFVEVSGIMKACAANLIKVATDLRLLSSGPDAGIGELNLPARQSGSSIMPGKINPVIPEAVTQAAIKVAANDQIIFQAASMGNLELNAFMPLIADAMLESLNLLIRACNIFSDLCVKGITVNQSRCQQHLDGSTAVLTALIEKIGYHKAQELGKELAGSGQSIAQTLIERGLLTAEEYKDLVSPNSVTRLGR
ncbi:MAG: aspartate ammonia-lyase [Sedimentisphaerales bacterium]|nr:aspartate ammonia-lyase [Sedimentisphaerales bacterium]MBN2843930.1 aspartate ammonia-lyase [Sedimentisphaerales bacterium]